MFQYGYLFIILAICSIIATPQGSDMPRVFVTDSQSWSISGGSSSTKSGSISLEGIATKSDSYGKVRGGSRPQTVEIIKSLHEKCPGFLVTNNKDVADYVIVLDREGGKGAARKKNKFVVFNKSGDAIKSGSTRSLGNSVKDACNAMKQNWRSNR